MAKRPLTPSERKVLRALSLMGKKNDELAAILDCAPRTLKFHVGNTCEALGVETRAELQAHVLRSVVKRLAEVQGEGWPRGSKAQLEATYTFLTELFDGSESPLAEAFSSEEPLVAKKKRGARKK